VDRQSVHIGSQSDRGGEEGIGGAKAMIEDRLFERFPCDSVFAETRSRRQWCDERGSAAGACDVPRAAPRVSDGTHEERWSSANVRI
jgi:hypothetical protein